MLDLRYRALRLGFLATSGVTTLIHRKIFEMARHGSAQPAELAIGLLTFMLASAGVLLLIHGSRLFARELPHRSPARDERRPDGASAGSRLWQRYAKAEIRSRMTMPRFLNQS